MYGSWVIGNVLYGEVLEKNLLNSTFYNAATGMEVKADYFIILHFMMMRHFEIMAVMLLMTVMSICLGIFLGFHLYISKFMHTQSRCDSCVASNISPIYVFEASINMTTNEFFKWRAVKKFHKKETKRYHQALQDGKIKPIEKNSDGKSVTKHSAVDDADVGCTGSMSEMVSKPVEEGEIFNPGPLPKNIYK